MNEILLRRRHKLNIEPFSSKLAEKDVPEIYRYVIAIAKNIESLGFSFDPDVIKILKTYSRPMLIGFYRDLIPMLDRLCAADVEYRPMYPNFPEQVASASDAELYINALLHYWTSGEWMPEYAQNARMPLIDADKMTVLTVGGVEDILDIFANLVASKTSLSEQDKKDVRQIMLDYPAYAEHMPDEIPLKENVAMLAKYILEIDPSANGECIARYFKTATDVLRFIVSLSGGDVSLAARTHFKHLRRPERRLIMNLLSACGNLTEDLFRYRDEWIRIGEIVHPWEFTQEQYKHVRHAFDVLRNQEKPLFLMGEVEEAIKRGHMLKAAKALVNRPGEFARRLDKLLRDTEPVRRGEILKLFEGVADQVSTPVLLQLRQVFIARMTNPPKVRVFMPKGSIAKAISVPYDLPEIGDDTCALVVKACNRALAAHYRQRDPMGCVYIDPAFRDFIAPFSQRSASSGNKILVRGSRVPIREDAKTVRGFIWWTNTDDATGSDRGRVDLDLSACILDKDFKFLSHVSYTNLRNDHFRAYHSGDIVDGGPVSGKGVAEFVDMNIDSVVRGGGRYICYQVYSFTRQKFSELPNCRFGWMEREEPDSGEIFEPKTVEMAITLNSESTVSVPVLFDCVERKFIWMDMSVDMNTFHGGNNLESNLTGVRAVAYAIANINKPTLYDLVYLNALARGCVVCDRESADVIFSNDTTKPQIPVYADDYDTEDHIVGYETKDIPVITAFDVDYYMGKLL